MGLLMNNDVDTAFIWKGVCGRMEPTNEVHPPMFYTIL